MEIFGKIQISRRAQMVKNFDENLWEKKKILNLIFSACFSLN